VVLQNGQTINSWTSVWNAKKGNWDYKDKKIAITPIQTISKVNVAKTAVTLYKAQPLQGAGIATLKLTTPANVSIGAVQIEQKGIDALRLVKEVKADEPGYGLTNNVYKTVGKGSAAKTYMLVEGYYLEQRGSNDWTIYFEDGSAPTGTLDAKFSKFTALKASYAVKLEVWAEGAYKVLLDGPNAGKPDTLKKVVNGVTIDTGKVQSIDNYKKSKPTIVTVTVNMK
jgi:hypothetical protein